MFRHTLVAFTFGLMFAGVASAQTMTREEFEKQIDGHRQELKAMSREIDPIKWAKAQANLGLELTYATGPETAKEAIAAYKSALEVYSEATTPVEWADTEEQLGLVYYQTSLANNLVLMLSRGQGEHTDPTPDLLAALQAFEAAKQVRTQAAFPREWGQLQLMVADIHVNLSMWLPNDNTDKKQHRDTATAAYNSVLQGLDEKAEPLHRGRAHQGLASMNEHGYVNETDRMQFALEHAKLAKADFIAGGEPEMADGMDRTISRLEYDLKSAETHVPDANDDLFGAKYH